MISVCRGMWCRDVGATKCVWKSEDSFVNFVLSLFLSVSSLDQTHTILSCGSSFTSWAISQAQEGFYSTDFQTVARTKINK